MGGTRAIHGTDRPGNALRRTVFIGRCSVFPLAVLSRAQFPAIMAGFTHLSSVRVRIRRGAEQFWKKVVNGRRGVREAAIDGGPTLQLFNLRGDGFVTELARSWDKLLRSWRQVGRWEIRWCRCSGRTDLVTYPIRRGCARERRRLTERETRPTVIGSTRVRFVAGGLPSNDAGRSRANRAKL